MDVIVIPLAGIPKCGSMYYILLYNTYYDVYKSKEYRNIDDHLKTE